MPQLRSLIMSLEELPVKNLRNDSARLFTELFTIAQGGAPYFSIPGVHVSNLLLNPKAFEALLEIFLPLVWDQKLVA